MKQGWEYKKIGNICNISTGKLDANAANEDGLYPFFTCSRIPLSINTYAYDCECILIAGNGDLNVKYYNGKFNAYQRTYILQLKIDVNGVDMRYIFAFFNLYIEELRQKSIGGIIKYIKLGDLTNALLPLPDITTQLSIVSELDKINELIRLKKEQLKDYDNLAQSIFYEMFGDPVENEKGWKVRLLKELCTKIGSGATPKGGNESYKQEGTALIRSLNVYNNEFRVKDLAFIDNAQAAALNNVTIEEQDVLLNITGASVARCCIVPTEILPARVNQHVCILRHGNNLYAIYLNRLFTNNSYQRLLQRLSKSKAATREALPKSIVDKLPIPLPSLPLQHLFAQRIDQIEHQKSAVQKSITDLETLLASRMQYWFE